MAGNQAMSPHSRTTEAAWDHTPDRSGVLGSLLPPSPTDFDTFFDERPNAIFETPPEFDNFGEGGYFDPPLGLSNGVGAVR